MSVKQQPRDSISVDGKPSRAWVEWFDHIRKWINDLFSVITVDVDNGRIGINETSPDETLHLKSGVALSPRIKLEYTNEDDNEPGIIFFKNSLSPADSDDIGALFFDGNGDAATLRRFAVFGVEASDVSDGDEAGQIKMQVLMDNTLRNFIALGGYNGTVNQGYMTFNEDAQDVDIRAEAVGVADALQVLGSAENEAAHPGYVGRAD